MVTLGPLAYNGYYRLTKLLQLPELDPFLAAHVITVVPLKGQTASYLYAL